MNVNYNENGHYDQGPPVPPKKTSKWKIGCAAGCGTVLLLIVILAGMGYFLVKDTIKAFNQTAESTKALIKAHGKAQDYCPPADGSIEPARLEIFLAVRERIKPMVEEMEQEVVRLIEDINLRENKDAEAPGVVSIVKSVFGTLPRVADYFTVRNRLLLEQGMGVGEYYYLYSIVYYSWLKHSPNDGPDFDVINRGESRTIRYAIGDMLKSKEDKEETGREELWGAGSRGNLGRVRALMLPAMRGQMKNLDEETSSSDESAVSWREALEAEIDAMEKDRNRVPWYDGLPDRIADSLEPLRQRLENTYYTLLNPLEFGLHED